MVYVGSSWVELDYWTSPSWGDYDARLRVLAYSVQDITSNTSTVYFKLQKRVTGGSAYQYDNLDFEISCTDAQGVTHTATQTWNFGSVSSTSWTDVGGDTHDMYWGNVHHKSDGSLSFTVNAEGDRILGGSFDTDISVSFPTIPRASSPTISPNPQTWSNTTSNTITVTTNRKSSSFTHTVRCDVWAYDETKTGVGASTTFTIPYDTAMASMPKDQNSFTGSVYTQTKNGSTNIGSEVRTTWTIKVDTSIEHANVGTITVQDTNTRTSAITQDDSIYIANISTLLATIPLSVSGNYTELASATVTCGSRTQNYTFTEGTTSTNITFEFDKVNASLLTVTVKDRRGNTKTATKSWTLIEYQPVTVSATVSRLSATGSAGGGQVTGMAYGGMFGQTENTLTVVVEFKKHDETTYTGTETYSDISVSEGYSSYTYSITQFQYQLDYQYQYDIKFTVSDLFSTAEYVATLMQGLPVLSWDEDEVDVFGNLHIHDREDPYKYQSVLDGFDAVLEHDGHKNLITMMTPTKTENGVTFTNNGTYYLVNGTATANAFCNATTDVPMEVGKKYILSGLHDQWVQGMQVTVRYVSDPTIIAITEEDDVEFTCPAPCYAYLVVRTGTTVSNKRWYPMIRDARIASETYVPGSMGMQNLRWSGTWSNSSSITRNYRIFGKGLVFAQVVVLSDTTNDTGTVGTYIDLRTSSSFVSTLGANANRLNTANTASIRSSSTGVYYYDGSSSNDRLRLYASCTKNGTNSWYINITTIGCTIQQI